QKQIAERVASLTPPTPENVEPSLEHYRRFVVGTTTGQLLTEAETASREAAAQRLYRFCESLRGEPEDDIPLAIRTLLMPQSPALCASFWMDLTTRLLARKAPPPIAFWTIHADRPNLLVLLGRPSGRTFLHLLRDDVPDDSLC